MSQLTFKFPFKKKYFEQDFYVSKNNFSAYKLIESWPAWTGKWLNIYVTSGSGKDSHTFGTAGTTEDSYDKTSASVSYAVASGVTAYLGYSDVDSANEGVNDTTDGSAWYIGANMSF